jgi:hypothetical protein
MADIIGNDMGFNHKPSMPEFLNVGQKLSRRDLLVGTGNAPMLVINGADDYFIPQAESLAPQISTDLAEKDDSEQLHNRLIRAVTNWPYSGCNGVLFWRR